MRFVISLILNVLLCIGLIFSVNELFQNNNELSELKEELWNQDREQDKIISDYNKLEVELEQSKVDMAKLSDMFAIHMRSHR
jgi:DNA integrity scanning protein DisA with diadenylate cyclase activity|tara:strand:- start:407 stop:652 length:246 start_codon:yes stop_codon:yes gene_type:complete